MATVSEDEGWFYNSAVYAYLACMRETGEGMYFRANVRQVSVLLVEYASTSLQSYADAVTKKQLPAICAGR